MTHSTTKKASSHEPRSAQLERERLKSLINSMGDGVIATDEQGTVVVTNGAALNILDSNDTLQGASIFTELKLVNKQNKNVDLKRVLARMKVSYSSRNWRIQYTDGSESNVYVSIAPVKLGYGQTGMHGYVFLLRDITREKSLEEERDEFISVVSHELRTPIAIAEGNISNASFLFERSGISNSTVKKALDQAYDQITFLSGMVNDLATLSRAERGKLTLEIEPFNPHTLIEELVSLYDADAKHKGLSLTSELDPHLKLIHTSKLYTKEILQNFVTNAIKYTDQGSVTIAARRYDNGVEFSVHDTGIGISKQDKEKVFEKFFRSEDYRTRANSGTGLGLYVTMKLAHLIQAEIFVESELNHGSTFYIRIPDIKKDINKGQHRE